MKLPAFWSQATAEELDRDGKGVWYAGHGKCSSRGRTSDRNPRRTDTLRKRTAFGVSCTGFVGANGTVPRVEDNMDSARIWIEQCEAARGIEAEFGTQRALDYLVGEKFMNFLETAEDDADLRAEIPTFVAEVKSIFERWQLAQYLETARETVPFDPTLFDGDDEFDSEEVEDMRKEDIRQCTRDLLLVERAKDWLLED